MRLNSFLRLFSVLILIVMNSGTSVAGSRIEVAGFTAGVLASLRASPFDAASCADRLNDVSQKVEDLRSTDWERADLVRGGRASIQNLWQARTLIRERMTSIQTENDLPALCVKALRRSFRSFRFLEEYIGLHLLPAGAWVDPQPKRVFTQGFPWLVQTANWQNVEFRSGDVLVSYGMAYGSAAIAHVGEDSGTFSHVALVYQDPKGVTYTIEAHPEFGVKVAPIEKYLADGKGRSALFRHRDRKLAATAAEEMFRIAATADWSGHAIPYDFTMNMADHSTIFCTEVVKEAFDLAATRLHRTVNVPRYSTKISMQNTYILDSFGIAARTTFAPSDIEVDSRFELMGEWRDLGRARLMHHQQAALQSQFKWLDTLDYNYHVSTEVELATQGLWLTRHTPLFDGLVSNLVPSDLSQTALRAVVQVYLVSDVLRSQLVQLDQASEKNRGVLLTQQEVLEGAEAAREWDAAGYVAYQRWQRVGRARGEPAPAGHQWHWILHANSEHGL